MKKRTAQDILLTGAGTLVGLLSVAGCNDYLTGQDGEPAGPLKVVRLTLLDPGISRDHSVFTDTSVPPDCMDAMYKDSKACKNDPFGDMYGVLKSQPNPDSARRLRVVFNKVPLTIDGMELERVPEMGLPTSLKLSDPSVISLSCTGCSTDAGKSGVPATYNSLQLTGSDLSPEPSQFPFGPGLQMEVLTSCSGASARYKCCVQGLIQPPQGMECKDLTSDPADDPSDPLAGLEPGSTYTVVLKPGLGGRNASDKVLLDDAAKALLTFNTEAFQALGYGSGAEHFTIDEGKPVTLPAFAKKNAMNMDELVHGVLIVDLNAPVDESLFTSTTATATIKVNGTELPMAMVPQLRVSTARADIVTDDEGERVEPDCTFENRRHLYIGPANGSWGSFQPMDKVEVTITLKGGEINDVSQVATPDPMGKLAPTHPAGKGAHKLAMDLVFNVALNADPAQDVDSHIVLAKDAPGISVSKTDGMDNPVGITSYVEDPRGALCLPKNRLM
jgi:hypothetical protein